LLTPKIILHIKSRHDTFAVSVNGRTWSWWSASIPNHHAKEEKNYECGKENRKPSSINGKLPVMKQRSEILSEPIKKRWKNYESRGNGE
jgi:hypothetical protein